MRERPPPICSDCHSQILPSQKSGVADVKELYCHEAAESCDISLNRGYFYAEKLYDSNFVGFAALEFL